MDFGLIIFELAKGWIPKLWDRLGTISAQRRREIESLADRFGDPYELAKYYVEPDCQQVNPADFQEDEAVVREKLFSRLQTFISGTPARENNQLFILSDAGMGKTSALLMLKLAHLLSFWPPSYDCCLVKLGPNAIAEVEAIKDKRKTVLLLDALDEDPKAWGRITARLSDILRASKPFLRVIITCRTQFFESRHDPFNRRGQVEVAGFLCPVIYASLFTDRQVIQYINKRFPEHISNPDWVVRASNIVKHMGFLRMRPMLLAHLEDLLSSQDTIWNEYSIYRALIESWLLREQRRAQSHDPNYAKLLKDACRHAAIEMHKAGRRQFTKLETELVVALSTKSAPDGSIDLGGRSLLNKDSDGYFRFSHYSVQEFLVFEYLITHHKKGQQEVIRGTDFINQMGIAWLSQAPPELRKSKELSFINFQNSKFDGAVIYSLALPKTDLRGAQFTNCRLIGPNFSGATLANATFFRCHISEGDFRDCNLTGSSFAESELLNCHLDGAGIHGADFGSAVVHLATAKNADYDPNTIWPHVPGLAGLGAEDRSSVRKLMSERQLESKEEPSPDSN